jgi:trk system potassium uptake protein TrkH
MLCVMALTAFGMSFFDVVCHALSTISTGGFSIHDASFGHFTHPGIHWSAILFMISGAIPFVTYLRVAGWRAGRTRIDEQTMGFLLFVLFAVVLASVIVQVNTGVPPGEALRLGAFNAVSITTTTGFASADYLTRGAFAGGLFLAFTFIGGCTGSTSRAIKIFRYQLLIKVVVNYIQKLTSPNRVTLMRFNGRAVPNDVPLSVLAFIAAYLGTVVMLTVFLTAGGLDIVTSFSGAATAVGNVGPGLGPIGPAGNFATLPDAAVWALAGGMLLGRLELFTLLVPSFWRD